MENLINYGIISLNKPIEKVEEKTIIVMGMARSGTSMVARVLDGLGIFLGSKRDNAVFEDVEISKLLEANDEEGFKKLIQDRNTKHKTWGWKRPNSISQVDLILKHTRNPHFIILYRDLLAIALRNQISMEANLHESLKFANSTYQKINEFVASCKAPTLLISYEKALIKKRKFLEGLCNFTGKDFPENHFGKIISLIEQDRPQYVANSTIKKVKGEVKFVENNLSIKAVYPHKPQQKVELKLKVNDSENPETLFVEGKHLITPSSKIELDEGLNKIEVFEANTGVQLKNSPLVTHKDRARPIYIFLHIPKTAGTSFRVALEKSLNPNQLFPNTGEIKKNNGQYPPLSSFTELPIKRIRKVRFIAGHYKKQAFENLEIPLRFITFFRKPEERVISNLIHFKTYDPRCSNLGLDEIFELRKGQLVDLQWKFLLQKEQVKLLPTLSNEELKTLAQKELKKLHFFGIKEQFNKSIELLNSRLNLNLITSEKVNPQKIKLDIPESLRQNILPLIAKEEVLYKEALQKFNTL